LTIQQKSNLTNVKEKENYKELKVEIENIKNEVNVITNILNKSIFTNSLRRNVHL
jgi:ribosomal protein L3